MNKKAKIMIVVGFFGVVCIIAVWRIVSGMSKEAVTLKLATLPEMQSLEKEKVNLERAEVALKKAKIRNQYALIPFKNKLYIGGIVGVLAAVCVSVVILAAYFGHAKLRASSLVEQRVGNSVLKVHYNTVRRPDFAVYCSQVNEIEAIRAYSPEQALQMAMRLSEAVASQMRAFSGRGKMVFALPPTVGEEMPPDLPFSSLIMQNRVAPGQPLFFGSEKRTLQDLKTLAVAGLPGSGKTTSMGYLCACGVYCARAQAYIIDPHSNHDESLTTLVSPLLSTDRVQSVNPYYVGKLLVDLNQQLDRRLAGAEPSDPPVLIMIDELARLSKCEVFDDLIAFLERCVQEARKANMLFIGGSQTWTARYFNNRADIRQCMNSMLIHGMKPSQADLLIEDSRDRKLVKQLQHPGQALLSTGYGNLTMIKMPYCTREDMITIANRIKSKSFDSPVESDDSRSDSQIESSDSGRDSCSDSISIRQVEKATGIPYSALYRHIREGKDLKPEYKIKYEAYLCALKSTDSSDSGRAVQG